MDPHHTVVLSAKGNGITVTTKDQPASFVLLSGRPNNEPIVQYGPFVMTTGEEIQQAFMDYQSGKNGFEKAPDWRSEIGRSILDDY